MDEETKKTRTFERPDGSRFIIDDDDLNYIFKGYRPRALALEDFKQVRRVLKKELKQYLKGRLVHVSKVNDAVWAEYTKDMKYKPKQKGNTYVKARES
jgi:hypothetical protein